MSVAWEVSATSGMCGADIEYDFIHELDDIEIIHLENSALRLIHMIKTEKKLRTKGHKNG